MDVCGTSNTYFQTGTIIEETFGTSYIEKTSKKVEYINKFKEYKLAYKAKWKKLKVNPNEKKYKEDIVAFIEDMKPYNKQLKNDEITKDKYMKILNKRKIQTVY